MFREVFQKEGRRGAAICSILAGDTLRVEGWECALEQSISIFKVTCHEVDCGKFVKKDGGGTTSYV